MAQFNSSDADMLALADELLKYNPTKVVRPQSGAFKTPSGATGTANYQAAETPKDIISFNDAIGIAGDMPQQAQSRDPASEPFARLNVNPLKELINAREKVFNIEKQPTFEEARDKSAEQTLADQLALLESAMGRENKWQGRRKIRGDELHNEQANQLGWSQLKQRSLADTVEAIQRALGLEKDYAAINARENAQTIKDPVMRQYQEYFQGLKTAGDITGDDAALEAYKERFRKLQGL